MATLTAQVLIADKQARLAEIDAQIEVELRHLTAALADAESPVATRLGWVLGCQESLNTLARRRGMYVEVIEAMTTFAALSS